MSVLGDRLKAKGLNLGEDVLELIVNEVFDCAEEEIKLSKNKFDDLLLPGVPLVRAYALDKVDKLAPEPAE